MAFQTHQQTLCELYYLHFRIFLLTLNVIHEWDHWLCLSFFHAFELSWPGTEALLWMDIHAGQLSWKPRLGQGSERLQGLLITRWLIFRFSSFWSQSNTHPVSSSTLFIFIKKSNKLAGASFLPCSLKFIFTHLPDKVFDETINRNKRSIV